jgi:aquaporin Z
MVSKEVKDCVSEFLGTYILVLTVGANVLTGSPTWAVLSIASSLMVAIFALGSVSGANFNPAVSLALFMNGGMKASTMAMFWVSQLAGGIAAALTATAVWGEFSNFGPAAGFSWVEAGAVEVLYTFMLCFVVLRVAVAEVNSDYSEYFPIAIGFVVVAGGYAGGGISGGAFNPAVAFGLDVASAHLGFKHCLVYTLFEFVGAALAVAVHMTVDSRKDTEPTLMKKAVSEFVGTFFLVLTVFLNVSMKSPAGGLSIAASLMCMIYALGGVSGANFNPAVTLALLITGKGGMTGSLAPVYMGSQLAGGFAAALTSIAITGIKFDLLPPTFGFTQALIGEMFFTFVLCFTVLNVACTTMSEKLIGGGPSEQIYGWAIGMCIMVGAGATGNVSGACLNPAVALPIDVLAKDGFKMTSLGYTGIEFLAAGLAAGGMMAVRPAEFGKGAKKPII